MNSCFASSNIKQMKVLGLVLYIGQNGQASEEDMNHVVRCHASHNNRLQSSIGLEPSLGHQYNPN